jgi:Na+/citrate or Na+/malate symporter
VIILFLSGVSKLYDPYLAAESFRAAFESRPLHVWVALVQSMASIEIVAAAGIASSMFRADAARLAELLAAGFVLLLALGPGLGISENCGCFGRIAWMNTIPARSLALTLLIAGLVSVRVLALHPIEERGPSHA